MLVDRRCNNKRDLLPALHTLPPGLAATDTTTPHSPIWPPLPGGIVDIDPAATLAVSRSIYSHLPLAEPHCGSGPKTSARPTLPQP
jgi:hypothetical protein